MGIGGISIWQLLIILLIVVMLFGTRKLRTLGADLGGALKGFRNAMKDDETEARHDGEDADNSVDDQPAAATSTGAEASAATVETADGGEHTGKH